MKCDRRGGSPRNETSREKFANWTLRRKYLCDFARSGGTARAKTISLLAVNALNSREFEFPENGFVAAIGVRREGEVLARSNQSSGLRRRWDNRHTGGG